MNRINKVISFIAVLTILISCNNHKLPSSSDIANGKYELMDKITSVILIDYNEKNMPVRTATSFASWSPYEEDTFNEESIYYYDSRDSLIKKETFEIYEDGSRSLSSIEKCTDNMKESIKFSSFPNDTSSYSYRKLDDHGYVTEEYSYVNFREMKFENKYINEYNDSGQLLFSIDTDLINGKKIFRKYTYETKNDTLFRTLYENDTLSVQWKKYMAGDIEIETSKSFQGNETDTVYTSKHHIKSVSYHNNSKSVHMGYYDDYGNEIKYESQIWTMIE